jgi:hypothetical protein
MPVNFTNSGEDIEVGDRARQQTLPPWKPPGPRRISDTPQPLSSRLHFISGKEMPWSVVLMTSVLAARP